MWRRAFAVLAALIVLASAARAQLTIGTDADTFVDSKMNGSNFGNLTTAEVGRAIGLSGVTIDRALLHFDLSTVPPNTRVTGATLRLFIDATTSNPLNLSLTVFRLTGGFNENTVTWNTQPSVLPSPTDSANMNTSPGMWFTMDLTALVQAARSSNDPTNLWLRIAPTDESTDEIRNFDFRTKENGSGTDRAQLVLMVSNTVPALSATMIAGLLVALGLIGALALRRTQRRA